MKANELRIGNLVSVDGMHYKVYSIHSPMPIEDEKFYGKYYVDLWNNGIVSKLLSDLEPVSITEELLISYGFDLTETWRHEDSWFKSFSLIKNKFNITFTFFHNDYYEFYINDVFTDVKYFHEIQNFVLLISREELELKIKD